MFFGLLNDVPEQVRQAVAQFLAGYLPRSGKSPSVNALPRLENGLLLLPQERRKLQVWGVRG